MCEETQALAHRSLTTSIFTLVSTLVTMLFRHIRLLGSLQEAICCYVRMLIGTRVPHTIILDLHTTPAPKHIHVYSNLDRRAS